MSTDTDVALLKKDVLNITELLSRLDTAIEKLTEVSNCVSKLVAVHEEKINENEKHTSNLYGLIEKRREERDADLKRIYDKMEKRDSDCDSQIADLRTKLQAVNRVRYILLGGILIIGFIIGIAVPAIVAFI